MKGMSRALRWRAVVVVRCLLLRLRHPACYYSWPTPFVLWRDAGGGVANERRADAIYLWPHGLRWWFLGFALVLVLFVGIFLRSKLPGSWYWYCLGVLVWMIWLYPFLVFYVRRREVLSDLWGTWPRQLDGFYSQQASELVTESVKRRRLYVLLPILLNRARVSLTKLGKRRLLSALRSQACALFTKFGKRYSISAIRKRRERRHHDVIKLDKRYPLSVLLLTLLPLHP